MINFPKKILVGKSKATVTNATICPVGSTSGEKKKAANIRSNHNICEEFDNIPLPGFTLKEGSYYHKDMWEVIDPRGFLVYIERINLDKILSVTGITEGLIQQMCVWARDNSGITMTLVPVTSRDYEKFTENTELLGNKPSMREVEIGDEVKLQNELVGIYRGSFNLHGPMVSGGQDCMVMQEMPKRHVIEIDNTWFYHTSNPHVVQIIKKSPTKISKEDCANYLNCQAAMGTYFGSSPTKGITQYWSSSGMIHYVTLSKETPTLELEEVDKNELINYLSKIKNNNIIEYDKFILEDDNGKKYALDYKYGGYDPDYCYVSAIKQIEDSRIVFDTIVSGRYGSKSRSSRSLHVDNIAKCYRTIKKIGQNERF